MFTSAVCVVVAVLVTLGLVLAAYAFVSSPGSGLHDE